MNTIIFKVTGNRLKRIGGYDPVSGESKYTKLRFEFDKEWSGVDTATVTMFFDIKDTHNVICEVNNSVAEVDVNEALRDNSGVLWVGVTGVSAKNGATLDCELVAVPVGQGTVVTEVASTKLYQQIIEYLAQIEGKLIDEDNPITTSLIQNFAVTEDKIKGGAVTPEKLDRRYWERVAEYNPIISYADLFEKVGYINTGGSIAQVVVNITTGTEGTINGLCLAYGRKSANGDTIYLINNNTGDFWKITRTTIYNEDGSVNNLLYKPVLLTKNNSITLEDGTVTPEKLDREYWQIVSRNPVIGYDYFDAILEESFAPDTIYRIHFSGLSPIYRVVGEGSFIAVTRLDCSGLMLINVTNGDRWIYEKGSGELVKCDGNESDFVCIGHSMNDMTQLRAYPFEEGKVYYFTLQAVLGVLTGGSGGYCYGRYYREKENEILDIFKHSDLSNWRINLTEGTIEPLTGIQTKEYSTTIITLSSDKEYRFTSDNLRSLTLALPSLIFVNFECSLVFKSGDTAAQLNCPSTVKWSGDDVASVTNTENGTEVSYNCLVPQKNKIYNIIFWYDGFNVNAVARGVSND